MKTILVLTDFSISADYMADYALALAQNLEANLLLCNIYIRPADENISDRNAWSKQACEQNSIEDLGSLIARLKTKLDEDTSSQKYKPEIDQCSIDGSADGILATIFAQHNILLAVISAHSRHSYGGIFQKNHAWQIIDQATFPVMVIPYQTRFAPYKQISFATGLHPADPAVLESVSSLASYSGSEILITHVTAKHQAQQALQHFFDSVTYPKISYHAIYNSSIVRFLKQQCFQIDLMILTHYKRSFLQNIFSQNVTRRMAAHPRKPLLIYPQT